MKSPSLPATNAKRLLQDVNGLEQDFAFSRRDAPEVLHFVGPPEIKGRREDWVLAAPAVPQAVAKEIGCLRAYRFGGNIFRNETGLVELH